MRLGILTSTDTRHRYFAQRLCAALDVGAVAYEETGYAQPAVGLDDLTPDENLIVDAHFAERRRQEEIFFGDSSAIITATEDRGVHHVKPGELNEASTLQWLESCNVDTLAVLGTNLIKPPLLDRWPGRTINMHLGLSPYYRGTATNFYPLLNDEPEYVGATIHLLDAGIDSGPILRHARPIIVADDQPHTIGCKAIVAGIEAMIHVLRLVDSNGLDPVAPWAVANPKLYLRRDYHPRQVVELYRMLEAGLIPKYVRRASEVAGLVRLVS